MQNTTTLLGNIEVIIFDFDGVLTDNKVYLDQEGKESVSCSRADGLAFDVMHKLKIPTCILSTEKNLVVTARANKLKTSVMQGVADKVDGVRQILEEGNFSLEKTLFVGNDLNDYRAMRLCGYAVCPADSHKKIKEISDVILRTCGGDGVARELLEDVFQLDFIHILYPEKESE